MNRQDKERITELAAQLRDVSKELNYIKRYHSKYELQIQARIVHDIANEIIRTAESK